MITHSELLQILHYDKESGVFTWKLDRACVKAGSAAGTRHYDGYIRIWTGMRRYYAHRLAWFYVFAEWPENEIDHINGIRDDNRIANLRPATRKENCRNSVLNGKVTSGARPKYKRRKKSRAA